MKNIALLFILCSKQQHNLNFANIYINKTYIYQTSLRYVICKSYIVRQVPFEINRLNNKGYNSLISKQQMQLKIGLNMLNRVNIMLTDRLNLYAVKYCRRDKCYLQT